MTKSIWAKAKTAILLGGLLFAFAQIFSTELSAQQQKQRRKYSSRIVKKKVPAKKKKRAAIILPKVTQIDAAALKNLLTRDSENPKPLLINFWATWCEPCREEFPDLVKINQDYSGKIDFITISLDYLSEIRREVPKFLAAMKAEMPAYLLKTDNEDEAIVLISKNYQGGLPFTILLDAGGSEAYSKQGKITPATLRAEIDKLLNATTEENKSGTKLSLETKEANQTPTADSFNRKPFNDFGYKFGNLILKNEVNINAALALEIAAGLNENGRLVKPVVSVESGSDAEMTELAKEFIGACSDSEIFKLLYALGSRNIRIKLVQDENNLKAVIQSETKSDSKTKNIVAAFNLLLKMSAMRENSDEAILFGKAQVSGAGKVFTLDFSISHEEKNQLIEKALKRLLPNPPSN